jgi:hypothetical protein
VFCGIDANDLIAAHTQPSMGQQPATLGRELERICPLINDHEIVADAVHLAKT